jgi:hypothetical protein
MSARQSHITLADRRRTQGERVLAVMLVLGDFLGFCRFVMAIFLAMFGTLAQELTILTVGAVCFSN